ncbi:MAG: hypothetical protein IK016_03450 [Lachnospiraceae bacterium]|nr:hypothetical protein [Lachnospiraceae bacterium]
MKKTMIVLTVVLAAATAVLAQFPFARPKDGSVIVELGGSVPLAAEDYLDGLSFVLEDVRPDTSLVDTSATGVYEVRTEVLWREFTHQVEVIDTTAPALSIEVPRYLQINESYDVASFVEHVSDLSGDVALFFETEAGREEQLCVRDAGSVTGQIIARDASGNEACADFTTVFDDAPVFVVVPNTYIVKGEEEPEPGKYIVAYDETDKRFNGQLAIDDSRVDYATPGIYTASCVATDSYGLSCETGFQVEIVENKKIALEKQNESTLSEAQMRKLVEIGYFRYEPLKENDAEAVIDLCAPAMCNIEWFFENTTGPTTGSGFIYRIGAERVDVLSVKHVVNGYSYRDKYGSTRIRFLDGNPVKQPERLEYDMIDVEENEIAMFHIDTEDIPFTTLMSLKQIYYDENIYEEIGEEEEVMSLVVWFRTKERIRSRVGKIYPEEKTQQLLADHGSYKDIRDVCITDDIAIPGVSGGAAIDLKGRLLGVYSWYHYGGGIPSYDAFCKVDQLAGRWGSND